MRLHTHLWTSLLTAVTVYPRKPVHAALLVSAGVLIDLDHLIVYNWRSGDWSIVGALCYNRYRNHRIVPGDTRPRYGKLRSLVHQPLLILPLIWWLVRQRPALRPVALGLTLHLTLDSIETFLWWCKRWGKLEKRGD